MRNNRQALKETIRLLEIKQEEEKELFNQQLRTTFESLKPSNLIKSTLKDVTHHTLEIKDNLLESFLPLITRFISGRLIGKGRKNSFSNLIATMIQMTLTKYAAQHSHTIITYFNNIIDQLKAFIKKVQTPSPSVESEPLDQAEMEQSPMTEEDQSLSEDENKKPE